MGSMQRELRTYLPTRLVRRLKLDLATLNVLPNNSSLERAGQNAQDFIYRTFLMP